jgi:hypothetical protein
MGFLPDSLAAALEGTEAPFINTLQDQAGELGTLLASLKENRGDISQRSHF